MKKINNIHPSAKTKTGLPFRWLGALLVAVILAPLIAACTTATPSPTAQPTSTPEPATTSEPDTATPTSTPEPTATAPSASGDGDRAPGEMRRSSEARVRSPNVSQAELLDLVTGNNAFALELYQAIRGGDASENLFYSPYSISQALAMTYAGARDDTAQEMIETLNFTLPRERLHPAFNALDLRLMEREDEASDEEEAEDFQLNIVNAVWGQEDYTLREPYLDILARYYGSGLRVLDFQSAPDEARQAINQWVSEQTEGKIMDLLPPGSIRPLTRLVLTNAIYFNAPWMYPFEEEQTEEGPFYTLAGETLMVPMMRQVETLGYAAGENYQAIELPYVGGTMSMLILLPAPGEFEAFESALDAERVNLTVANIEYQRVALTLPKFTYDARLGLSDTLAEMGMPRAFSPEDADFSGMTGDRELYIQDVLHKAYVSVDEAGTEAAAATGVVVGTTSMPAEPREVVVDRPFVFMIRDRQTGALLFVGRVMVPSTNNNGQ